MRIKFLTLNILHGGELFDPLVKYLTREDADIITLQEVQACTKPKVTRNLRTIEEFENIFPKLNYVFHPEANLTIQGEENVKYGNATYTKFSIAKKDSVFFKPYRNIDHAKLFKLQDFRSFPASLLHCEIKIAGRILDVFNIHGIWGFDGEDSEERLKMSRAIVDAVKDKKHVILAGDFNMLPNTKSIEAIQKYLTPVFGKELRTSFNIKRKDTPGNWGTSVVDMIFVSPNIRVLNKYCPNVDVSDHLPLVAELDI